MRSWIILWFIATLCIGIFAGNQGLKGAIHLSGSIENPEAGTTISLRHFGKEIEKVPLEKNGGFEMRLEKPLSDFYQLRIERKSLSLFLLPGDRLIISADMNHFEESLTYRGVGAKRNTYLMEKDSLGASLGYTAPLDFLRRFKGDYRDILLSKLKHSEIKSLFRDRESKEIQYEYASQLLRWAWTLRYHAEAPKDLVRDLDRAFDLPLKEIFSRPTDHSLSYLAKKQVFEGANATTSLKISLFSNTFEAIKTDGAKEAYLSKLNISLWQFLQSGTPFDHATLVSITDFIAKHTRNERTQTMAMGIQKEERLNTDATGQMAPNFALKDVQGKEVELADFRGKYVYIDFWATWCKPCFAEMEPFKKLVARFKNHQNIAFLAISIDAFTHIHKWQKISKQKDFGVPSLIAGAHKGNSGDSAFLNALNVNSYWFGIPQFALIDPNGRIVDAFTYRPSHGTLDGYLRQLLNTQK